MKEKLKEVLTEPKYILFAVLAIGAVVFTGVKGCIDNSEKKQVNQNSPTSVIEENFDNVKEPTPEVPATDPNAYVTDPDAEEGAVMDANVPDEEAGDDYYLSDATKAISMWFKQDGRYECQTQSDFDWDIFDASVLADENEMYKDLHRLSCYVIANEAYYVDGEQVEPEGAAVAFTAYVTDKGDGNVIIHFLETNRETLIDDGTITYEMDDRVISAMYE